MNYDECVNLIKGIEAEDTQVKEISIDIYDVGQIMEVHTFDERETERTIDFVESFTGGVARKKEEKPKQQAQPQVRAYVPAQSVEKKRKQSVANDLSNFVGPSASVQNTPVQEVPSDEKLILPTLSLQDQISELEKISAGLDSRAFNADELSIIKMEVAGLMKNPTKPSDAFQQGLAGVRDARLKQVSRKLGL